MNILGLNVFSHDTSAALIHNGQFTMALEQERLNQKKHTKEMPIDAALKLLAASGLEIGQIDAISVGWDFARFVNEIYLRPAISNPVSQHFIMRDLEKLTKFLDAEKQIRDAFSYPGPIRFYGHHECHAEYSFRSAGVESAVALIIDGYGDAQTTSLYYMSGMRQRRLMWFREFPHSLGLYYSAITYYLGFQPSCDEGIVMGLASYGNPLEIAECGERYIDIFRDILRDDEENVFKCNLDYLAIGHWKGRWITDRFIEKFGPKRDPKDNVEKRHMDIAAALQKRLEEVALNLCKRAKLIAPQDELLVLGGGVALNCVMNSAIQENGIYKEVLPPPSPGDGGVAVGAALLAHLELSGHPALMPKSQIGLGPKYTEAQIQAKLSEIGLPFKRTDNFAMDVAQLLAEGKILGWFQGGSEFGPRALGQRSILAAPYPAAMKDTLNARVKFREYFRPFAPIVPKERANEYFEIYCPTPYMMHAFRVRDSARMLIPAAIHVDGTCRVQTLERNDNPELYSVLEKFEQICGVPVLLNTSFNVKGQPIVESPEDALESFKRMNLDSLVIGPYIVSK